MISKTKLLPPIVLLFSIFINTLTYALDVESITNYTIRKIIFEGVSYSTEVSIRSVLKMKEGDTLKPGDIIEDTKTLATLGYFYDFRIEYEIVDKSKGLVDIYIVAKESDTVNNVKFEGNKSLNTDDLKEVVLLSKGDYFNEYKILGSIIAIKEKYKSEGFLDVIVNYTFEKGELTFVIKEGPRSIVKNISIIGATNITSDEILTIMETKKENKFLFLTISSGSYNPDTLKKDMEKIEYYYKSLGFIKAKVISNRVDIKDFVEKDELKEKHVYIEVYLEEGQKFYIGQISIVSDIKIFKKEEILSDFPLLKGDVLFMTKLDTWLYNLSRKYWDRGYIFTRVDKKFNINEDTKIVDIDIEIQESDIGRVGNIVVVGNSYTKTHVIEREIVIKEGEIFNLYKIQRSVERLNMTQFFDKVEWEVKEGEAEGILDLVFKVKEGKGGLISLGGGWGSVSGFSVSGSISHVNLFGTGRRIQGRIEYGQNQQLLNLSYQEPYIFNSKYSVTFSIYFLNTLIQNVFVDNNRDSIAEATNGEYWQLKLGFGIQTGRRIGEYWNFSVGYSIYDLFTHSKNFEYALDESINRELGITTFESGGKIKSSLSFTIGFDSRDQVLAPRKGIDSALNVTYSGGVIGGFYHFINNNFRFSFYQSIPITSDYGLVWVFYTSQGVLLPQYLAPWAETNGIYYPRFEVETSDRYWFDGYYELRGWTGYSIRGKSKALYTTELRIPLYDPILWGTFFADLGTIFEEVTDYTTDIDRYYSSFGLGIMINISMLPIRLYLARPVIFENKSPKLWQSDKFFESWQFVFSIQGLF